MKIKILAIVEQDGDGFHAYCPAFKGLHIDGSTEQEALSRTIDGLKWYLDSLERHGDPIPVGPDCVVVDDRPMFQNPEVSPNASIRPLEVQWLPSAVQP
jgi:predicted RNase H-like HicB family nuclease